MGQFYTELFFLDEPTALAAGHRPCFECRRQAAKAFRAAFPGRSSPALTPWTKRSIASGSMAAASALWRARLGDLPDGAMIARDGRAYAVRAGALFPWSFAGYGAPERLDAGLHRRRADPALDRRGARERYRPLWAEALALPA